MGEEGARVDGEVCEVESREARGVEYWMGWVERTMHRVENEQRG